VKVEPKSRMKKEPYGDMSIRKNPLTIDIFFRILTYIVIVLLLTTMFAYSVAITNYLKI